jgi:hypothetical protein
MLEAGLRNVFQEELIPLDENRQKQLARVVQNSLTHAYTEWEQKEKLATSTKVPAHEMRLPNLFGAGPYDVANAADASIANHRFNLDSDPGIGSSQEAVVQPFSWDPHPMNPDFDRDILPMMNDDSYLEAEYHSALADMLRDDDIYREVQHLSKAQDIQGKGMDPVVL